MYDGSCNSTVLRCAFLSAMGGHSKFHYGAGPMSLLFWCVSFAAALVVEVSFLPRLTGGWVPALSTIPLLAGIALQGLPAGFLFAVLAGVLRDVVTGGGIYLLTALGTFLAMRLFLRLTQWERPLGAIAAVAVGLLLQPLIWLLAARVLSFFFSIAAPAFGMGNLTRKAALQDLLFTLLWVILFSWSLIRMARSYGERRLRHL